MGNVGPFQILIILGIALLVFGASRIADIGKGLGEGIRNFKRGLKDDDAAPPKQLTQKTASAQDEDDDEGDSGDEDAKDEKKTGKPGKSTG